MKRKIGIIDSKSGGFHLLKRLQNDFKNEDFIYFDVKYFESMMERDFESEINHLLSFVLTQDLKLLIIASDLISSIINEFEININIPHILTTNSLIEYTNQNFEQKIMLFLAKERVFETSIYPKNLKADQLLSVTCDDITLLVEQGEIKTSRSFREVISLLQPYQKKHVDVFVSGCTNISLLTTEVLEALPTVEIISLFDVISTEVREIISKLMISNQKGRGKICIISENDKRNIKQKLKLLQIKTKQLICVEKFF